MNIAPQLARLAALLALGGCGAWQAPTHLGGDLPRRGSLIPATNLKLAPSLSIPLEKVVNWGAYVGVAYLIVDPLAPNWEIEEAQLAAGTVHLSLHMKRYYAGGTGEARVVFHRRAQELMRSGGYEGYQVLEYTESLESSVLGAQRLATGVIRLSGDKPPG